MQALQANLEAEKAAAAAAVTEGPLAAAQAQLAEVQVGAGAATTQPANRCLHHAVIAHCALQLQLELGRHPT